MVKDKKIKKNCFTCRRKNGCNLFLRRGNKVCYYWTDIIEGKVNGKM